MVPDPTRPAADPDRDRPDRRSSQVAPRDIARTLVDAAEVEIESVFRSHETVDEKLGSSPPPVVGRDYQVAADRKAKPLPCDPSRRRDVHDAAHDSLFGLEDTDVGVAVRSPTTPRPSRE